MKIETIKVSDLKPYPSNPRKNDTAVDTVVMSIKEFGFKNPIIIDKDNEIIAGHTRLRAAKLLKLESVPAIRVEDLTPDQVKAYRIMDNKSQDLSQWDYGLLKQEFAEIKDIESTGFEQEEINFFSSEDGAANNPYQEWRKSGGLDYANDNKSGYQTILLHFKDAEDVKAFSELLNQTITEKTKYLWFPKQESDSTIDLKYEDY